MQDSGKKTRNIKKNPFYKPVKPILDEIYYKGKPQQQETVPETPIKPEVSKFIGNNLNELQQTQFNRGMTAVKMLNAVDDIKEQTKKKNENIIKSFAGEFGFSVNEKEFTPEQIAEYTGSDEKTYQVLKFIGETAQRKKEESEPSIVESDNPFFINEVQKKQPLKTSVWGNETPKSIQTTIPPEFRGYEEDLLKLDKDYPNYAKVIKEKLKQNQPVNIPKTDDELVLKEVEATPSLLDHVKDFTSTLAQGISSTVKAIPRTMSFLRNIADKHGIPLSFTLNELLPKNYKDEAGNRITLLESYEHEIGNALEEFSKYIAPGDEVAKSFSRDFAQTMGNLASFYGMGAVSGMLKAPRLLSVMMTGGLMTAESEYKRIYQETGDNQAALNSIPFNFALGMTEGIPIERVMSRVIKFAKFPLTGAKEFIRGLVLDTGTEVIQETGQNIGSDITAKMFGAAKDKSAGDIVKDALYQGMMAGLGTIVLGGGAGSLAKLKNSIENKYLPEKRQFTPEEINQVVEKIAPLIQKTEEIAQKTTKPGKTKTKTEKFIQDQTENIVPPVTETTVPETPKTEPPVTAEDIKSKLEQNGNVKVGKIKTNKTKPGTEISSEISSEKGTEKGTKPGKTEKPPKAKTPEQETADAIYKEIFGKDPTEKSEEKPAKTKEEVAQRNGLQIEIMQKAGIPEKLMPDYALDSIADGKKLGEYADDVLKGDMTTEEAIEKVRVDYNKMAEGKKPAENLEEAGADKIENEPTKQESTGKQPYEMTRDEFGKGMKVNRGNNYISVQSNYDDSSFLIRSTEADKITDGKAITDSHKDYIRKAIQDGKTIPESVLKDYPELQNIKPTKTEEGNISNFSVGDIVLRKHDGIKYKILGDSKGRNAGVVRLKNIKDGKISVWNSENNGGFSKVGYEEVTKEESKEKVKTIEDKITVSKDKKPTEQKQNKEKEEAERIKGISKKYGITEIESPSLSINSSENIGSISDKLVNLYDKASEKADEIQAMFNKLTAGLSKLDKKSAEYKSKAELQKELKTALDIANNNYGFALMDEFENIRDEYIKYAESRGIEEYESEILLGDMFDESFQTGFIPDELKGLTLKEYAETLINNYLKHENRPPISEDTNSEDTNVETLEDETTTTDKAERDTETITSEAEALASESQTNKAGKTRRERLAEIEAAIDEIDSKIGKLIEEHSVEGIAADYPIQVKQKEIKKEVTKYAKEIARILGWQFPKDKKGKDVLPHANIPPAGGEITFDLEIPGTPYVMYVQLSYDPEISSVGEYDNYKFTGYFYRVEDPTKSGYNQYIGGNNTLNDNLTAKEFAKVLVNEAQGFIENYKGEDKSGNQGTVSSNQQEPESEADIADSEDKLLDDAALFPEEIATDKKGFPIAIDDDGKEHVIILHGITLRNGWEWYGMEKEGNDIYFGYVMGFEDEWGSFSVKELRDNGVSIETNPEALRTLAPPIGWKWKKMPESSEQKPVISNQKSGNSDNMDSRSEMSGNDKGISKGKAEEILKKERIKPLSYIGEFDNGTEGKVQVFKIKPHQKKYDAISVDENGFSTYTTQQKYIVTKQALPKINRAKITLKNDINDDDIKNIIDQMGNIKKDDINRQGAPVSDEQALLGMKLVGAYINKGVYKLEDILAYVYNGFADKFNAIYDTIRGAYVSYRMQAPNDIKKQMTGYEDVENFSLDLFEKEYLTLHNTSEGDDNADIHSNRDRETDELPDSDGDEGDSGGSLEETSETDVQGTKGNKPVGNKAGRSGKADVSGVSDGTKKNKRNKRNAGAVGGKSGVGQSEGDVDNAPELEEIGDARGLEQPPRDYSITDVNEIGSETFSKKKKAEKNIAAIKLVNKLDAEKRKATEEEQKILAQYVGWGGIPDIFDERKDEWSDLRSELSSQISLSDYNSAKASVLNAHYTAPEIIQAIYRAIQGFGFANGRILEPSAGIGSFFMLMPQIMKEASKLAGIELDYYTGKIAEQLTQTALWNIKGYEEVKNYEDGYFDLITSNVPFGDVKVFDPDIAPEFKKRIHNYFFAKSIFKVRNGGIIAFITSKGTLDAESNKDLLNLIRSQTKFLGAIRLPNNAFLKNANTKVVTDIIFLKKNNNANNSYNNHKLDIRKHTVDGKEFNINGYFLDNPEMVIGDFVAPASGGLYGGNELTVEYKGNDFIKDLNAVIDKLPKDVYTDIDESMKIPEYTKGEQAIESGKYADGQFFVQKDEKGHTRVYQVRGGAIERIEFGDKEQGIKNKDKAEKQIRMIELARDIMVSQSTSMDDNLYKDDLLELNKIYDNYVEEYGFLNEKQNIQVLVSTAYGDDPYRAFLLSLENYDELAAENYTTTLTHLNKMHKLSEPKSEERAEITKQIKELKSNYNKDTLKKIKSDRFKKRTAYPANKKFAAETVKDALTISYNIRGGMDIDLMSKIVKKSYSEVIAELKKDGLIFFDGDKYVDNIEYLSGNVKAKLQKAKALLEQTNDRDYENNIKALEEVLPDDKPPSRIGVSLSSEWVGADTYEDFLRHLLGLPADSKDIRVIFNKGKADWSVDSQSGLLNNAKNITDFGTPDINAVKLTELTLNNKKVVIKRVDNEGNSYVDNEATFSAQAKQDLIKSDFKDWVFKDADRATKLANIYNQRFNNIREREYDGSHLTLPDMNREIADRLFPHVKDAVWRIINNVDTLLAHKVGLGKTWSMCISAMEMRRLGIKRKPIHVVKNNMVRQYVNEFYLLYPNAKLLAIYPDEIKGKAKEKRKIFLSKIANNEWDSIIIPNTYFTKLPVSPNVEKAFIEEQIAQLVDIIQEEEEAYAKENPNSKYKSRTVKQLEKIKENFEVKVKNLMEKQAKKDYSLYFEDLGIDQFFIDEAHNYKNLFYTSRMQMKGLNRTNSVRALDMYLKTRVLREKYQKGVVFATGTPIGNTIAEMFTMMRYLQPNALKDYGLENFDTWVNNFGKITNDYEINILGTGLKLTQRASRYTNVGELSKIFRQVADVKGFNDGLGMKNKPNLKTNAAIQLIAPVNEHIKNYLETLANRYAACLTGMDPRIDNVLKIMTDGRKAALDLRLVGIDVDLPDSKINQGVNGMFQDWKDTKEQRGVIAGFIDMGTPSGVVSFGKQKQELRELKEYLKGVKIKDIAKEQDKIFTAITTAENPKQLEKLTLQERVLNYIVTTNAEKADIVASIDDKISQYEEVENQVSNINLYQDVKNKLIAKGVPAEEIVFAQDFVASNTKRQKLFDGMNKGTYRIVLTTKELLGEGVNAQQRLYAEYLFSPPHRPMDLEQIIGRMVRNGNTFKTVKLVYMASEGSFDTFMWQQLERKSKFITEIMDNKGDVDEVEDIDERTLSYAEMTAISSGNPEILELHKYRDELQRLTYEYNGFEDNNFKTLKKKQSLPGEIEDVKGKIKSYEGFIKPAEEYEAKNFEMDILGEVFEKPDAEKEKALTEERYDLKEKLKNLISSYKVEGDTKDKRIAKFSREDEVLYKQYNREIEELTDELDKSPRVKANKKLAEILLDLVKKVQPGEVNVYRIGHYKGYDIFVDVTANAMADKEEVEYKGEKYRLQRGDTKKRYIVGLMKNKGVNTNKKYYDDTIPANLKDNMAKVMRDMAYYDRKDAMIARGSEELLKEYLSDDIAKGTSIISSLTSEIRSFIRDLENRKAELSTYEAEYEGVKDFIPTPFARMERLEFLRSEVERIETSLDIEKQIKETTEQENEDGLTGTLDNMENEEEAETQSEADEETIIDSIPDEEIDKLAKLRELENEGSNIKVKHKYSNIVQSPYYITDSQGGFTHIPDARTFRLKDYPELELFIHPVPKTKKTGKTEFKVSEANTGAFITTTSTYKTAPNDVLAWIEDKGGIEVFKNGIDRLLKKQREKNPYYTAKIRNMGYDFESADYKLAINSPFYRVIKDLIDTGKEFKPTSLTEKLGNKANLFIDELNQAGFFDKIETGKYKINVSIEDILNTVSENPDKMPNTYAEFYPEEKFMRATIRKDIPINEEAVTKQIKSANSISELPVFTQKIGYRVHSNNWGIPGKASAADIIKFEREELGNDNNTSKGVEKELKRYNNEEVLWVTAKKEDAETYLMEDEEREISTVLIPENSKIVANDEQGGYLVLVGYNAIIEEKFMRTHETINEVFEPIRAYTESDIEEIKAIHKQYFGNQAITAETLQIVKNALQHAGWFGKNIGNLIQLADFTLAAEPLLPIHHEGFHKSFSILLTRPEQEKMLTHIINRESGLKNALANAKTYESKRKVYIEAEEYMNDDYQAYRKSRKGFKGTLRLMFDEFTRRLKLLIKNFPKLQELAKKLGMEFDYAKMEAEKIYRDILGGKAGKVLEDMGMTKNRGYSEQPAYMKAKGNLADIYKTGTPTGKINVFRGYRASLPEYSEDGREIYFTDKEEVAREYSRRSGLWISPSAPINVRNTEIEMQNPFVIDAMGTRNDNIPFPGKQWKQKVFGNLPKDAMSVRKAAIYAKENGYDGLIVKNVIDTADPTDRMKSNVYVVFDKKNISAKPNSIPLNSKGKPLADTEAKLQNFYKWFGNSKVVDEQGRPLVVYHGTRSSFNVFKKGDIGYHFGTQEQAHERISTNWNAALSMTMNNQNIMPVYLRIENPLEMRDVGEWGDIAEILDGLTAVKDKDLEKWAKNRIESYLNWNENSEDTELDDILDKLKQRGYDGIKYKNYYEVANRKKHFETTTERSEYINSLDYSYIIFDKTQVKSATGNKGTYDLSNPDINYMKADEYFKRKVEKLKSELASRDNISLKTLASKTGFDEKALNFFFKRAIEDGYVTLKKDVVIPSDRLKHIIIKQAEETPDKVTEIQVARSDNPAFDWLMSQKNVKMQRKTTVGKTGQGQYGAAATEHTPKGIKGAPEIRHIVSYADYTPQASYGKEIGRVIANEISIEVNNYKSEYLALGFKDNNNFENFALAVKELINNPESRDKAPGIVKVLNWYDVPLPDTKTELKPTGAKMTQIPGDKPPKTVKSTQEERKAMYKQYKALNTGKYTDEINWNTSNFSFDEDINRVIANITADDKAEISNQKRGVRSWEVTESAADMIGLTDKELLATKPGDIENADWLYGAKVLLNDQANRILQLRYSFGTQLTNEERRLIAEEVLKLTAMRSHFMGIGSEVGRALNILRDKATAREFDVMTMEILDMIEQDKILDDTDIEKVDVLKPKIRKIHRITRVIAGNNQKLLYWFYTAILSNPMTDLRNITGNLTHLAWEATTMLASQNPKYTKRMINALSEGIDKGWADVQLIYSGKLQSTSKFQGLEETSGLERYEWHPKTPISKTLSPILLPLPRLTMEDAFFRRIFEALELEAVSIQMSKNKEESDINKIKENIKNILENRKLFDSASIEYQQAIEDIDEFVRHGVFQMTLEGMAQGISHISTINKKDDWRTKAKRTAVKMTMLPFVRISANLLKVGMENTPYGVTALLGENSKNYSERHKYHIRRRFIAGTAFLAGLAGLVATGMLDITGSGPEDKDKRKLWENAGYKPNHLYIGNFGIPYININPFNVPFAIVGNTLDAYRYNKSKKEDSYTIDQTISRAMMGFTQSLMDQSFMRGVSDIMRAINDKDPNILGRIAVNILVPSVLGLPKTVYQYATGNKPMYKTESVKDIALNKVGLTGGLQPQVDVFGEQRQSAYETLPYFVSKKGKNEIASWLLNNLIIVGAPSKNTKINNREMTTEEYTRYEIDSGRRFGKFMTNNFDRLKTLPVTNADFQIKDAAQEIRKNITTAYELYGVNSENDSKKWIMDNKDIKLNLDIKAYTKDGNNLTVEQNTAIHNELVNSMKDYIDSKTGVLKSLSTEKANEDISKELDRVRKDIRKRYNYKASK